MAGHPNELVFLALKLVALGNIMEGEDTSQHMPLRIPNRGSVRRYMDQFPIPTLVEHRFFYNYFTLEKRAHQRILFWLVKRPIRVKMCIMPIIRKIFEIKRLMAQQFANFLIAKRNLARGRVDDHQARWCLFYHVFKKSLFVL